MYCKGPPPNADEPVATMLTSRRDSGCNVPLPSPVGPSVASVADVAPRLWSDVCQDGRGCIWQQNGTGLDVDRSPPLGR
jgi:hypothetical protein